VGRQRRARCMASTLHLWGHLRTLVYAAPADNGEALHRHTVNACRTVRYCRHARWVGRGGPTAWPPRSTCGDTCTPLCMQLLLTTGRHFTVVLWMPVGLSATAGMRSVEEYD
jgi:hypothetical protein